MTPTAKITFDNKMLNSNIFLTVPNYNRKIDLMHIYLILMLHIKHASDLEKLDFQNVRLSVPISA